MYQTYEHGTSHNNRHLADVIAIKQIILGYSYELSFYEQGSIQ